MDISGSLVAVTSALGLVKELREIDAQFDKAELKLKIAELTSALSDAKLGLVDVAQSLRDKDEEIAMLLLSLKRKEETVERNGYRFRKNSNGEPIGNAFCPICIEAGSYILTTHYGYDFKCPKCKANFGNLASYAEE